LLTESGVTLRAAFFLVAVACAASSARALPQCEEELSAQSVDDPVPAPEPTPPLPVVPCAMVESGVLGPACADATFYVVTDAGVLLCSVDVDTFQLTQAPARAVETLPAVPVAGVGSGLAAFATVPDGLALPVCLACDVDTRPLEREGARLDRGERPPLLPS
jgi:hypothetical protein